MNKIYYLSTCNTCKRIFSEAGIDDRFEMQDIKTEQITEEQLAQMAQMAGSYEALFSRVARKYKELNLKEKSLSEVDFKNFILEEYTFLKRPVVIVENQIFIGNSKKNVEALIQTVDII
ncbi:MAG: hypothetical protein JEZ03_15630 [Bacteroidales bacterium]|nr:hypothetical protein [Bacteroidales bacterium]